MALRKAVIQIEYLYDDEEGIPQNIEAMGREARDGSASAVFEVLSNDVVSKKTMAELLCKQGSDPEFLLGEEWQDENHLCPECQQKMSFRMVGNEVNPEDKTLVEEHFCPDCDK